MRRTRTTSGCAVHLSFWCTGSVAGQIAPPRRPLVCIPAIGNAFVVLAGDVEVDEIDAACRTLGRKRQDQGRVSISVVEMDRSPRLDDQPGLHHRQHLPAEAAVEGTKRAA